MSNDYLPLLDALMRQYRNRPMDFADATLVRIAERESLSPILTIDHDDCETYRIQGRRRFCVVPGRASEFKRKNLLRRQPYDQPAMSFTKSGSRIS